MTWWERLFNKKEKTQLELFTQKKTDTPRHLKKPHTKKSSRYNFKYNGLYILIIVCCGLYVFNFVFLKCNLDV